uniref:UDP-glucuronosyltransferase n=1 Tax=Angiostrongylus cantonensis TaxID=6313 RepID=A0A0K0D2U8_ANGCA
LDDVNSLVFPSAVSTGLLEVGFYCQKIGKLPTDFVNFVEDTSSKGTILVSFGSNADWDYAPDELLSLVVEALNRLSQYRIVFAYNGEKKRIRSIGQHIKITAWAPQVEILQHNKTVLFISHGGQKSVKETICGGVPAVYIPLFAEQAHNGELARKAGFAETLHKNRLSSDLIEKVVRKVAGIQNTLTLFMTSSDNTLCRLRNFFHFVGKARNYEYLPILCLYSPLGFVKTCFILLSHKHLAM